MSEFSIPAETDVLETLADKSPRHVIEIANTVDEHPITIDRTCAHLHDEECIRPLGQGLYEITGEGIHRLDTNQRS